MYYTVLIFGAFICGIRGQIQVEEKCPELTVQQNFDLKKYLGKWSEQASHPNKFELSGKCFDVEFTMMKNGTVKVVNSHILKKSGEKLSVEGTVRQDGQTSEGKLRVAFTLRGIGVTRDSPYWVLGTDYDSYAVAWSCSEIQRKGKLTSLRFVWLLTRERLPPPDTMNKIYEILEKSNISRDQLRLSEQNDCK